jgi:hypothetical protein
LVEFQNRSCFTGALILGDEVLLGAVPMEDMDVIISPAKQTLIINPESPNIPSSIVKKTNVYLNEDLTIEDSY